MEVNKSVTILHVGKLVTAHKECLCVVHSLSPREALVRTSLPMMAGESVTLGLRNGFSVSAVVGMNMGDHVSLLFEEHIAISTIIAEQRQGRSEREAVRLNIVMPITVCAVTGTHSCMMQDISLFGIKVLDEAGQLRENMKVQVFVEGLGKRDAMVRWCQDTYAGLSFEVALGFKLLDQWAAQIMG
ncbi:PilZ domain-containing protein [Sphingobium sp. Cam5-1]|uniref:PilZ domain-containing protein n=1 Tax=Sphingobium sp. Cam5-1 TaxID=2789327 RepID=UPI0018AD2614|nr:PilZ domain-containing protein [Sphingobium sp. Cam5-1]QPI73995.1 PilZ domain-containing protein [Sphingobium sp. Cam5-1]